MLKAQRKIIRLSTMIGIVAVLALAGLGLLTVNLARQSQWWVSHTQTVLGESKDLLASMMGAESSTRGFLITGDEAFRAPYKVAIASIPQHMANLKELTADNPGQQIRLGQLGEIVERKIEIMKSAQDARIQGRPPKMDTEAMNKFRAYESDFEKEEQNLFHTRASEFEGRINIIYLTLCMFGLAAVASMVFFERKMEKIGTRMRTAEDVARQAQKMESIGQLTGGVAHDFNNILQAVMTNLDLAARKLPPRQAESDFIQAAMVGLEKGARLTSQLLAFARRQPLQPEPIAVGRLLDESVAFLRRTLGEKYQIESIGSGGLWRAMIDSHLLHNALLNLALNARDAMPEGGKLTIEAANVMLDANYAEREREVTPGQYVMIAVSDTGTGMSKELIDRVFEPFFTTKAEGTGSGIAHGLRFHQAEPGPYKDLQRSGARDDDKDVSASDHQGRRSAGRAARKRTSRRRADRPWWWKTTTACARAW
jgi:signal transduction histidine kinase